MPLLLKIILFIINNFNLTFLMTNSNNNTFNIELEHGMGYNGSIANSLKLHPNLIEYVYIAGGVIIIAEMNDPNKQRLLRAHDDEVTCIALSHNGRLLASGKYNVFNVNNLRTKR
jgi:WD40 repeat protein